MKALVARGHEVTVISPNPLKEPLENYTDVDLSFSYEIWHKHCKFSSMSHLEGSEFVRVFFSVLPIYTEEQLLSPQLREFRRLNKNVTFDLVVFEWLSNYPYFGLVHEVGSPPIVGILSIGLLSEIHRSIGNPDFPSINPTLVYRYSDSMSFWQRLHNIYAKFWMRFFWNTLMTRQEELMRKYFGEAPPPVRDVNQNISLLIASDSYITDFPRALMPNLLQVTGLHIKENPEPLPQTIMKALVARGHEVTVISPSPLKEPLANYTDVDLSFSYEILHKHCKFSSMSHLEGSEFYRLFFSVLPIYIEEQLLSSQLHEFRRLNKNKTFDLVIFEWLTNQPYFGLVHEVGSPPIVAFLSFSPPSEVYRSVGNPDFPAVNPNSVYRNSDCMSFWQRLHNMYVKVWMRFFWDTLMTEQEKLMRKYFGDAPPPTRDVDQNISLLITTDSYLSDFPRALLPNLLQVTGLHITENPEPLTEDLQEWMDDSTEGIVYFSLGTNVKSKDLPESMHAAIVAALARLPLRVLWKWEEDELPGRPSNVRVAKWLPQQAVLAHPNTRLFITQGGLQSFQEALYYGVPLLGIPFFADQPKNVVKMSLSGVGRHLEFWDITEEKFYGEITEILENPKYKERMSQLSEIYREHKKSDLGTAVWWIEYVLRHKGAPHLRTDALSLPWYQYVLLDVVAVILLILCFLGCMSFLLIRVLCCVACTVV